MYEKHLCIVFFEKTCVCFIHMYVVLPKGNGETYFFFLHIISFYETNSDMTDNLALATYTAAYSVRITCCRPLQRDLRATQMAVFCYGRMR